MSDVSVVIPSIKTNVVTLQSIPQSVDTNVVREGTLNQARNIGVRQAEHDQILILDDDITFSEEFFWDLVGRVEKGTLVGHPDWDFNFVAGRVMAFHRDDWKRLGGFDERLASHMGDTEFSLKFVHGAEGVEHIDPDEVKHEPHERSVTTWDRVWRTLYIAAKYPTSAPDILAATL